MYYLQVIDTMEINEKTASFSHYFEPLYHVIHDMPTLPRPAEALLSLRSGMHLFILVKYCMFYVINL